MKPKKPPKMTLAEENKLRKKMGLPPRVTLAKIKAGWKAKAKAWPKDQRQKILDMIWNEKTIAEIATEAGVDSETVHGVFYLNRYRIECLRKETL